MKKKKISIIIEIVVVLIILVVLFFVLNKNSEKTNTDAEKFAAVYNGVSKDNVFVYRNIDEIINIIHNGTGIVYLGFPECQWCQKYVTYLNEVAKYKGLEKIYYLDIADDRRTNSEGYLRLVEALQDHLQYDDEGNKRIYVPDVTFIVKGEIISHDNETSLINDSELTPDIYWTEDKVTSLKEKFSRNIDQILLEGCSDCNK